MFRKIKAHFPRINRLVANISDWGTLGTLILGAYGILTVAMTWIASSISGLADHGWGAVVFAGIATAGFIFLVGCVGLVSWRLFKPLPKTQRVPEPAPEEPSNTNRQVSYDLMILLHFAVDHATCCLLGDLVKGAPDFNDIALEADATARLSRIADAESFIRKVKGHFANYHRGAKIGTILHDAHFAFVKGYPGERNSGAS